MARAAMETVVLDICVAKARHAATARHAMATKLASIDVQKVRHVAMDHHPVIALAVNAGLALTVRRTRQVPAPINHIRLAHRRENQKKKKATQNRTPPFDLS